MKKFILLGIIIIMSLFKNFAFGSYEKLIYDFEIKSVDGQIIDFSKYQNKAILLVNVASYCGFTKQYEDLQKLWEIYEKKNLVVIGVPSGSFNQEKSSDAEVKKFCEVNFNISFPITSIYDVKGEKAHDIYKWAKLNHGKSAIPKWNFHKILIGKNGKVIDTFAPFTNPMSKKVIKRIEETLN